jgi:hypothetical protein
MPSKRPKHAKWPAFFKLFLPAKKKLYFSDIEIGIKKQASVKTHIELIVWALNERCTLFYVITIFFI